MVVMRFLSAVVSVALLAAPAFAGAPSAPAAGEAKLARALEGYVAGEPVSCLPLHRARSSEIIDGTAILYRDGRRLYVNRPEIGASSLRRDQILVTRTFGSELCSIDTVNLVDQGSRSWRGFVGLGKFVPYVKADPSR